MTAINQKAVVNKLVSLRQGAKGLRQASTAQKNAVLLKAAALLISREAEILRANSKDVKDLDKRTPAAFVDRLLLDTERVAHMAESLRQVAALADPVGEVADQKKLPNGLELVRVRSPLGVILMIFESRPNVCIEAFSLAFKAGNVIILRGGRESMRTTKVLYGILADALKSQRFSGQCVWGVTDPNRQLVNFFLKQKTLIDVVVPRGGDGLINFVVENSKIPIIKNDRGLCHVYVHEDADLAMALNIVENGKIQRPGVCNSVETVLLHEKIAAAFLPQAIRRLNEKAVRWFVDAKSLRIFKASTAAKDLALAKLVSKATAKSFDTEYLDYKVNCRVVANVEEALAHIETHGSRHSDSIVTASAEVAAQFQSTVDSAAVYWNASTRFTDGFEMGLGGELGISTQKLHVRGPVGLRELTSLRWIGKGTGQIRQG